MRNIVLLFLLCFGVGVFLSAQSTAEEIETLLNTDAVTYAQAARFILEASDVTVTSNPSQAFQYAVEQKWLRGRVSANDTAKLDRIALLVMRSFDIKGGYFYSIFKNPHYAYHELVYQKIIQGRTDPSMTVSGDILLFITNRALAHKEQRK